MEQQKKLTSDKVQINAGSNQLRNFWILDADDDATLSYNDH